MTAPDFRATMAALGISQARLNRLLKLDKNTANRWSTGLAPVPQAVALLLTLIALGRVTMADIENL